MLVNRACTCARNGVRSHCSILIEEAFDVKSYLWKDRIFARGMESTFVLLAKGQATFFNDNRSSSFLYKLFVSELCDKIITYKF